MELNCEDILVHILKSLISAIVDIYKCRLSHIRVKFICVHHISMVLGRNINTACCKILNRMVSTSVSVLHLVCICACCKCHELMSEADCKNRHIAVIKLLYFLYNIYTLLWISRSV